MGIPREAKKKLTLTNRQRSLVIGTILGDGYLAKPYNWGTNYRLQITHSDKQKDYVFWKYNELKNWVISPPKFYFKTNSWRFRTISHRIFTELAGEFYPKGKKIIPERILDEITDPFLLAVWYMDDGNSRKDARSYGISTHSFSRKEHIFLKQLLEKNFGLEVAFHQDGKGNRLYIPAKMGEKFEKMVCPFIIRSMLYKFPLAP